MPAHMALHGRRDQGAEGFVNSSLSCLAFSQNPRATGVGKSLQERSRGATCDQSQLVEPSRALSATSSEVVHFQNIVSPTKKVLFFYNSPVFQPYLPGVQRTQGATGFSEIPAATRTVPRSSSHSFLIFRGWGNKYQIILFGCLLFIYLSCPELELVLLF